MSGADAGEPGGGGAAGDPPRAGTARGGFRRLPTSTADLARSRIATMAVTLRAFTRAAGAESAILLLDRGDGGQPFVVECPFEGLALLAEGEHTVHLDPDRLSAEPLPLPPVSATSRPFEPEAVREQIEAPFAAGDQLGAPSDELEQLARALRQLTSRFPGRSVLSATFPTTDPDIPLHIAARTGDPLVLALGDDQFEMPPDWPA